MKTKYDWSGVPSWVSAICVTPSGVQVITDTNPTKTKDGWLLSRGTISVPKTFEGSWQDSLEERPQ